MEGKEIFQITDFKKYDIIGITSCSPKPLYNNIKLRGLQTQRRQQERERHKWQEGTVQNTAYILIQSHNAEVGIFYRKYGIWYKYRYIFTWLEKIFEGDIYVSSRKLKKQFSRSDENLERPQDDQFHWGRKGLYVSSVWKFCILYLYRRITSTGWKQLI